MCDGIYLTDTGHQDVMMHLQKNSVRMVTYSNVQVVIDSRRLLLAGYLVGDTRTSEHKNTQ